MTRRSRPFLQASASGIPRRDQKGGSGDPRALPGVRRGSQSPEAHQSLKGAKRDTFYVRSIGEDTTPGVAVNLCIVHDIDSRSVAASSSRGTDILVREHI